MNTNKKHIAITAAGSVSSLGVYSGTENPTWLDGKTRIEEKTYSSKQAYAAALPEDAEQEVEKLKTENRAFQHLDRSVLLALLAAKQLKDKINSSKPQRIGVNIGSSRGATAAFENHYGQFLAEKELRTSAYASPTTTLGNVSSWVMQYLNLQGVVLSHSITCSTAVQAVMNAVAWLRADMADSFIVGGTEAPLTPFTLAQMQSMGIYSTSADRIFPCTPLAFEKGKGMVLGEGAALFLLEKLSEKELAEKPVLAVIEGLGYGSESIHSLTDISPDGKHFQDAMKMALKNTSPPDLIMLHAPGTPKGDEAELKAIKAVFRENVPALYSNKWQTGHTLGASAALSLQNALDILALGKQPVFPYKIPYTLNHIHKSPQSVMINAAGFGGNAGSLVVKAFCS